MFQNKDDASNTFSIENNSYEYEEVVVEVNNDEDIWDESDDAMPNIQLNRIPKPLYKFASKQPAGVRKSIKHHKTHHEKPTLDKFSPKNISDGRPTNNFDEITHVYEDDSDWL